MMEIWKTHETLYVAVWKNNYTFPCIYIAFHLMKPASYPMGTRGSYPRDKAARE
jgi:hypothetical protein